MATSVANYQTAASIGPRFLIGGLMLGVLTWWMKANHQLAPLEPVASVGAIAGLSVIWGLMRLRVSEVSDAAAKQIRASGLLAVVFALGLAAVAIWWAVAVKLDGLGETLGLTVFAAVALLTGMSWLQPSSEPDAAWQRVRRQQAPIGIVLALLGAAALGAFFYYAMVAKVGEEYAFDLVATMFAGFVLFFGGLYLVLGRTAEPNYDTLRIVFLVIGGLLGLILMAESVFRWFSWRTEISSAAALASENAWKFWLAAYAFAVGLSLVYGSFQLGVSMARENASVRQALFGYAAVASAVLLVVVLLFANVMYALKDSYTFNWTKRGLTGLSPRSKSLISNLDKKIDVYVLMSPRGELGGEVKLLLDNCQAFSNKLVVDWVDPERDIPKYRKLATHFPEIIPTKSPFEDFGGGRGDSGRGILLVYGTISDDVKVPTPHVWIPENRLEDQKRDQNKTTFLFKGETELMKEIDFLARNRKARKLYFLQGDDELLIASKEMQRPRINPVFSLARGGASVLVDKLKKDNFEVAGLSFNAPPADPKEKDATVVYLGSDSGDKKIDVPADCDTLVVLGPSLPIPRPGIDAIERYMDGKGRMVVFLDVFVDRNFAKVTETGLEELLKKYGVETPPEFLYRLPTQRDAEIFGPPAGDPTLILAEVPPNTKNSLAKQFLKSPLDWRTARVVKPGPTKKYQVEPLLVASHELCKIWTESNAQSFVDLNRYMNDTYRSGRWRTIAAREDVPLAVTVSENSGAKPRMVVFGDAEFVSNLGISIQGVGYDYAHSSIEWLNESTFVGPSPKETASFALPRTADVPSMVFGAAWTMMLLIVMFGVGTWLVRRR